MAGTGRVGTPSHPRTKHKNYRVTFVIPAEVRNKGIHTMPCNVMELPCPGDGSVRGDSGGGHRRLQEAEEQRARGAGGGDQEGEAAQGVLLLRSQQVSLVCAKCFLHVDLITVIVVCILTSWRTTRGISPEGNLRYQE